jgi:murein DD-endopeptidase MepM/ murein hydrolase activator NlpD
MTINSVFVYIQLTLKRVLIKDPLETPVPAMRPGRWIWMWLMVALAMPLACGGLRPSGPDGETTRIQRNAAFISLLSDQKLDPLGRMRLPVDPPPTCIPAQLTLTRWPLDGPQGKKWVINNYVDLDPGSPGLKDWQGFTGSKALTYDRHTGVDIDIASFREMDDGSAVVRAAAPGVVSFVEQGQDDRHTSCSGTWNVVRITHANGYTSYYGHLKKGSALVRVGDTVVAGQALATAGSSGCSTQPHVHFEVEDCGSNAVESLSLGMWTSPPAYDGPSDVMDVMLTKGAAPTVGQIKDPAPNVTLFKPADTLGIGLSMGGRNGDVVALTVLSPTKAVVDNFSWTVSGLGRFAHLYPAFTAALTNVPGTWTLNISINGALKATRTFNVSTWDPGFAEVARHGVPASDYQAVFDDVTTAGYRLVWIDGYDAGGNTHYNAIFRPAGNVGWRARHGISSADYQAEFDHLAPGFHPTQVESYLDHGNVRYAIILTDEPTTEWVAYHGRTEAEHQALFERYRDQGFRPVNVSVVSVNGARYFTALYDKANVGRWETWSDVKASDYQALFDREKNAGLLLSYLNAYLHGGDVFFTAVWNSVPYGDWVARHGLSGAQYQSEWKTWTGSGYFTRLVTGYDAGGATFAGLWTH